MTETSRRSFLKGAGLAAAAGAVAPVLGGALRSRPASATAYTGNIEGPVHDEGGEVFDIKSSAYGAYGDTAIETSGGSVTAGSTAFTAGNVTFASTDVGKVMTVQGAGASGGVLSTTIAAYLAPSAVMLADAAQTTVTGAAFAYGHDDTAAIVAAIAAAAPRGGTVLAPPGTYMIRASENDGGPIELSGGVGLLGNGASSPNAPSQPDNPTTFLCGDALAGLLFNGSGTYQGFCCDGNSIATAPLQDGKIVGGQASASSRNARFLEIWVINSSSAGWTVYGSQGNSYFDCRSLENALYGIYIDGGAGNLDFLNWQEEGTAATYKYGLYADAQVPGGAGTFGDHTENIRFSSGIIDGSASGVSRVYLRHAVNWNFTAMIIVGNASAITGPCIDLDQGYGYGLDFSTCWIWAGSGAGQACIQVSGQPPAGTEPVTFLNTDGAFFVNGDTSVLLKGYGNYYSAAAWIYDQTSTGPVAASGLPAIDTLLRGRQGAWQSVTVSAPSPWSGTVFYRIDSNGLVRLKGSVSSTAAGGGPIIDALPLGYRPAASITVPASTSAGPGVVTITPDGVVSGSSVASGGAMYLDGITFVPAFPLT